MARSYFSPSSLSLYFGSTDVGSTPDQVLVTFYTDSGATTPADMLSAPAQIAVVGSHFWVPRSSLVPGFYGPDGVTTLYGKAQGVATTHSVTAGTDPAVAPPNTGSVVIDSLVYSAKDHGLKGDNATNDQPALAALVTALGALYTADGKPRSIYCPAGNYLIKDKGTIWASGVSLIGAGPGVTRFLLSNPGDATNSAPLAIYITSQGASTSAPLTDCTFADFEVDGSGVTVSPYTTGMKALILQYMVRGRFRNLYLHGCGATALGCDFLQDTIIDNVVALNNGRLNNGSQPGGAGIGIGIGGWGAIERTTITNCIAKGNGAHGIFVELQNNAFTPPRGIRIIGCHSEGNKRGISDWGADGLIVSGCTIIGNTAEGFNISGSGVGTTVGRNGVVTGCVIDGNATDGVLIGDGANGYMVANSRISNNTVHGIHYGNTTIGAATSKEMSANNNDIFLNGGCGIRVDAVQTDGTINLNRIRNNGLTTASTTDLRSGFSASVANNSPTIVGNRFWDNQTTKTQTYGLYLTSTGTLGSATMQNNNANGNLTGAFNFAGGSSVTGGLWNQNAGFTVGATSGAQTTVLDGATYVNGALRYLAATRKYNSGTIAPSATANTNGTAATCSPAATQLGFSSLIFAQANFTGTFGSETLTITITATFSDNATATAQLTGTAASTSAVLPITTAGLMALTKDGTYVKTYAVAAKSTIASSTATATVDIIAAQN